MTSQNMTSQPAEIGKIIWLEYIKAALRPMPILQAINTSYAATKLLSKLLKHAYSRLNWKHEKLKTHDYLKVDTNYNRINPNIC